MITDWVTLALAMFDAAMVIGILAAMYWMR
jgi:hypothetical protein